MRIVPDHHDGYGFSESIVVSSDTPDASGAAHHYTIDISRGDAQGHPQVYRQVIQFQRGPRCAADSTMGVIDAALMLVMIDRLRGLQEGPYKCRENEMQLVNLEQALHWARARADAREQRGVLSTRVV